MRQNLWELLQTTILRTNSKIVGTITKIEQDYYCLKVPKILNEREFDVKKLGRIINSMQRLPTGRRRSSQIL